MTRPGQKTRHDPTGDPRGAFGAENVACLVLIHGGKDESQHRGKVWNIKDEIVLGRDEYCSIVLRAEVVSRKHAVVMRHSDGTVTVRDEGSSNGTFVNDRQLRARVAEPLKTGDFLRLGAVVFKVLIGSREQGLEAQYHEEQYRLAVTDSLTGLYNRMYLLDQLSKELAGWKRHGQRELAVAMLDLDLFKSINDRYGHSAGDEVLRSVGAALRRRARGNDCVARLGGEEFAWILPACTLPEAVEQVDALRESIRSSPVMFAGTLIPVTVSAGVAIAHKAVSEPGPLLDVADKRLFAAKSAGRNRVFPVLERAPTTQSVAIR